jgi:hypothetical protein
MVGALLYADFIELLLDAGHAQSSLDVSYLSRRGEIVEKRADWTGEMRAEVRDISFDRTGSFADIDGEAWQIDDVSAARGADEDMSDRGLRIRSGTCWLRLDRGPVGDHPVGNEMTDELVPFSRDQAFDGFAGILDVDAADYFRIAPCLSLPANLAIISGIFRWHEYEAGHFGLLKHVKCARMSKIVSQLDNLSIHVS